MQLAGRRRNYRMPLQFSLNEHVGEDVKRSMALNLGTDGIYVNRLHLPGRSLPLFLLRPADRLVGLEFELPATSEVIWARGELCHDRCDEYFHGTGVRFTYIADFHRRLIDDYVSEFRLGRLRQLLTSVRRNRRN